MPTGRDVRRLAGKGRQLMHLALAAVGVQQSDRKLATDSQQYWTDADNDSWASYSHWESGDVFAGKDLWAEIGRRHLTMFERGALVAGFDRPWGRVLEWGCGGGANAVHFAPYATEFVGVDVSQDSLRECARQVQATCDTPFKPLLIDVAEPETVLAQTPTCDVFLCCYVFELFPTPEYGERVLRIARQLLRPGGLALVQIKYDTGHWTTKPRRRAYRTAVADMTTYPIHTFWELTQKCEFEPQSVELVPRNELDERYAYFLLR
jgi:SAM-dependent methyltransferase